MDLSDLRQPHAAAADEPVASSAEQVDHGWIVASQAGVEVATMLTSALERMLELQRTGAIDRQGLSGLIEDVRRARQVGFLAQQLSRVARGGIQQQQEIVAVAEVVRDVAAQHQDDLCARGIALRQSTKSVDVVADPSMLASFVHAALDWATRHARTAIELRLSTQGWPTTARLTCHFGHVPADRFDRVLASTGAAPTGEPTHLENLDCLWWRLVQHLATNMQLKLARKDTATSTVLTVEFPQTTNESLEGATSLEIDTGFALAGESRPLQGSHVLVIAARRDVRNQVRQAVTHMGLMLDFVTSIEAALEFCQQGLPHAIIYEASLGDRSLACLRQEVAQSGRTLAWIEITEQGEAFEASTQGLFSMARVGRDALAGSLPSALLFELARAG